MVRVRLVNGLCHGLTDGNGLRLCEGLINDEACPREVGQRTLSRTHGLKRIWLCEGLIDGESCLREVGQRTLSRTHGRKRIWLGEGLIDDESCPREGEVFTEIRYTRGMQSQFITTNNINLHVMTDGPENGTTVFLLHGFPEFHYGWKNQIPALVDAGFRVIVPDQRGYNLSDKPKGISAYDVDILAKDIVGLFDHFGIQKARLIGHDWGAVVAWTVALNHSDRLQKLAILNVPHPDVMTDFVLNNSAQRKKSWYVYFFQIPWLVEWMLGKNNFEYLARMLVQSGRKNTFTESDVLEYKKAWSQKGALTGMLNWYRAAVRRGLRYTFSQRKSPARRVQVPTIMLWGKHDIALSSEMAQPSIDLCDEGELTFFNKSTHWVQHDASTEVNQKLIEFMR